MDAGIEPVVHDVVITEVANVGLQGDEGILVEKIDQQVVGQYVGIPDQPQLDRTCGGRTLVLDALVKGLESRNDLLQLHKIVGAGRCQGQLAGGAGKQLAAQRMFQIADASADLRPWHIE